MINDHYLAMKKWTPDFNLQDVCFGRTMVWVRFPCLNLMYYDEQIIKRVAWGIGKPVKVDMTTQSVARGRYARICMEIDLWKPVAIEIWMNDHWHALEYESLHLICASCGCYGHVARLCDSSKVQQKKEEDDSTAADQTKGIPVHVATESPGDSNPESGGNTGAKIVEAINVTVDSSNRNNEWITVRNKKKKSTAVRRK